MPKFLSRQEIYRILQRELPDSVYVDGAPSAFLSTADNDSVAQTISSLYLNLERVYDNYFPQLADERIADWEFKVFGKFLDSTFLTLEQRQSRVLAKIRSRQGITKQDMKDIVHSVIGLDKEVEIIEYNCHDGAWIIGKSLLGKSTYLRKYSGAKYAMFGPEWCGLVGSDVGLTDEELLEYRRQAYTYEVRIYDYTLTAQELIDIDEALRIGEPARSDHVIKDNFGAPVEEKIWPLGVRKLGLNTYLRKRSL